MRNVKTQDLTDGLIVEVDSGFTCMDPGPKVVYEGNEGFYLECGCGRHYLDGQIDHDDHSTLVGVYHMQLFRKAS